MTEQQFEKLRVGDYIGACTRPEEGYPWFVFKCEKIDRERGGLYYGESEQTFRLFSHATIPQCTQCGRLLSTPDVEGRCSNDHHWGTNRK